MIHKKGDRDKIENYRGVTLTCTAYKIYAYMLSEKLKKEVEDKLAESQFGFRQRRGVIEAIYTLMHIVDEKLNKPKGKIYACFTDLKEAFDRVDRKVLKERMTEKERCRSRGVLDRKRSEAKMSFKPNSIQYVYLADLEEKMKKGQNEGCRIKNEKVWSIACADDIVLIADRKEELKKMLRRFKKYLECKNMILSEAKTKILVFEKRREENRRWKWEDKGLEELDEIRYLGYILQKNGKNDWHMGERKREAVIAMNNAWSIGLNSNTPNYIVQEECKYERMRIKALRRVLKFEEKIRDSNIKLVKECIRERDKDREREIVGKKSKKRIEVLGGEKVKETRYVRGMAEEEPEYLKKDLPFRNRKIIARFRCRNECKSREYWK
ncbi:hypothetical protein M0804_013460 [Polistes exclamans]|nr:hypothetical protein M0804_013460 [Polistes exclamans]